MLAVDNNVCGRAGVWRHLLDVPGNSLTVMLFYKSLSSRGHAPPDHLH